MYYCTIPDTYYYCTLLPFNVLISYIIVRNSKLLLDVSGLLDMDNKVPSDQNPLALFVSNSSIVFMYSQK